MIETEPSDERWKLEYEEWAYSLWDIGQDHPKYGRVVESEGDKRWLLKGNKIYIKTLEQLND